MGLYTDHEKKGVQVGEKHTKFTCDCRIPNLLFWFIMCCFFCTKNVRWVAVYDVEKNDWQFGFATQWISCESSFSWTQLTIFLRQLKAQPVFDQLLIICFAVAISLERMHICPRSNDVTTAKCHGWIYVPFSDSLPRGYFVGGYRSGMTTLFDISNDNPALLSAVYTELFEVM